MKRQAKASLAFKNDAPSKKVSFGGNIITQLNEFEATGKSPYADSPVSIADLQLVNTTLSGAAEKAESGSYADKDALKEAITPWDDKFTLFANFVTTLAAGSLTVISNVGLVPTKTETQKNPLPEEALGMKATINGKQGAIIAETKKSIPYAKAYGCTILPEGVEFDISDNVITLTVNGVSCYIALGTKKKFDVENLPKGVPLSVTMFGFNGIGIGAPAPAQQVTTQGDRAK